MFGSLFCSPRQNRYDERTFIEIICEPTEPAKQITYPSFAKLRDDKNHIFISYVPGGIISQARMVFFHNLVQSLINICKRKGNPPIIKPFCLDNEGKLVIGVPNDCNELHFSGFFCRKPQIGVIIDYIQSYANRHKKKIHFGGQSSSQFECFANVKIVEGYFNEERRSQSY